MTKKNFRTLKIYLVQVSIEMNNYKQLQKEADREH